MKLFGTAGIRMKYPSELTPELVVRIGNAVGRLGLSRKAYVVHDTRTTSQLISFLVSTGLMTTSVDVFYAGLAPTPVAGFIALKEKAVGISVTASHNPPEYNGLKFYDPNGFEFTRDLEVKIEELVDQPLYREWSETGRLWRSENIVDDYYNSLLGYIGEVRAQWQPNIVIDCANGAAYQLSPSVIRKLGGKPYTFNCNPDGFFPIRPPEPRKDVLEELLGVYKTVNPVVIFAHDGDADRVAVLDPVEGFIRQDRILAFYAKKILEEKKGHVVVSIDTGYVVDEVVERAGGTLERYVLGKTHERLKELGVNNVVMAGEPWKLIYPSWGPWVDGILQVAIITKAVVESGKPFSKILREEEIPDYPWDRRSYILEPESIRDIVYSELIQELHSALGDPVRVIDIDGYRFEYKDYSWILVRKSGTEPKIRVYAEARTKQRLDEITSKTESILFKLTKKHGGRIVEKTIG